VPPGASVEALHVHVGLRGADREANARRHVRDGLVDNPSKRLQV